MYRICARGALAGLMWCAMVTPCLAAGVVADGSTSTTVTTGAGGHITVGVAAAVGGVSTNNYREFNVSRAGVDLDNTAARARTILNQVTGTNPSLLEGPLSVLGPRANVLIANPNGISVDGMVVRNVGNLALTTGQLDNALSNGQAVIVNVGGHFVIVDSKTTVNGTSYYMTRDPYTGPRGVLASALESVMSQGVNAIVIGR